MRLFIANTKKQVQVFTYRLVERQQPFARTIKPGGQVYIDNLGKDDIDHIIKQHEIYGMRPASEVASRQQGFVGLCYSVDREINMDTLLSTFDTNDKALDEAAQERRVMAAQAITDNIGREVGKVLGGKDSVPPQRVEVEITEDSPDSKVVASGVEVITNPEQTNSRRTSGKLSLRR